MTREELHDLISDAGYCVLATAEGDQPRARPMMPYLQDSGKLLLACLPTCRTIQQVEINPKVELCYIDRRMNFARIQGEAVRSDDQDKKECLWNHVPMLRQYFTGPDDEALNLLEIKPVNVEIMTPQQVEPETLSLAA